MLMYVKERKKEIEGKREKEGKRKENKNRVIGYYYIYRQSLTNFIYLR